MTKIFTRLFLTYALVIAVSSLTIALLADYVLKSYYRGMIAEELEMAAIIFAKDISSDNGSIKKYDIQQRVNELKNNVKTRITVINNDGTVVADSESDPKTMENHADRHEVMSAMSGVTGKSIRHSSTLNTDMMYVAVPIKFKGKVTAVTRFAMPLDKVYGKIRHIHSVIAFSTLFGVIIALIVSFVVARSFTKPIVAIKFAAEKLSRGDFSHRIRLKGNDELVNLAKSVNRMADELEGLIFNIEKEKNELATILESMAEGVIVVGADKKIIMTNPSFIKMFYFRTKEITGRHYWEAVGNEEINSALNETFEKNTPVSRELALLIPEERYISAQTSLVRDKEGKVLGAIGVFHDITQKKNLEKMRAEFFANASHELKTPLTAISGFVETLKDGAINDGKKAAEFLDIIQENALRLNNLVNDMLAISKAESKEVNLEIKQVDIGKLIKNVADAFRPKAESGKKKMAVEISPETGKIHADEEKLTQILSNLVDNALKFTGENGTVKIKCTQTPHAVKIEVSDTGIGIPKEHLPRIFERFYRVDKGRSREMGGTGLGLAIVKHLVQLHGGSVSVESAMGKGSTFTVELPLTDNKVNG